MNTLKEQGDKLLKTHNLVVGRHVECLIGYYACFYPTKQSSTDHRNINTGEWDTCGHGETVDEAVMDAIRVKQGREPISARYFEK